MIKLISVLIAVLMPLLTIGQKKDEFKSLSWLIGEWEGKAGRATLSETWTKSTDQTMIGKGTTVVNGETVVVENLQLHIVGNHLGYIASPNGASPTFFTLIKSEENSWTFENKEHDFPQRIIYLQKGPNSYKARIEGTNSKGEEAAQEFEFKRIK